MDKSEITYLYHKGFTIEEIRKLDTSLDNLTKDETKPSESEEAKDEKPEEVREDKPEKKNSGSSQEYDALKKELDELKELVQTNNRKGVDNPTPPEEKSIEEIAQELFNA